MVPYLREVYVLGVFRTKGNPPINIPYFTSYLRPRRNLLSTASKSWPNSPICMTHITEDHQANRMISDHWLCNCIEIAVCNYAKKVTLFAGKKYIGYIMSLMNASYYCLTWLSIKLLNLDRTITLSLAITVYIYMLPSLKMHPRLNFISMP